MSIGGNDIGFADVIVTCAVFGHCPLEHQRVISQNCELSPLELLPGAGCSREMLGDTLHDQVQKDLAGLRGTYGAMAEALMASGLVGDPAKVMLTEYPAIATEASSGRTDTLKSPSGTSYCDGSMRPAFKSGIADEEFAWASEVVQDGDPAQQGTFRFQRNLMTDVDLAVREPGLNTLIRSGPSGMTPVVGAATVFDGHGYCAPGETRYLVQLDDVNLKNEPTAPMHPNLAGQAAWGQLIAAALIASIGG